MPQNDVIMVGNGINDITASYSWKDLIKDLIKFTHHQSKIYRRNKSFPLLYEEIYLKYLIDGNKNERTLKEFISEKINSLPPPNSVHKKLMKSNLSDIITTNYDYTIEAGGDSNARIFENKGLVKENLYSVFRHSKIKKTRIWHIHGEKNLPRTILLGYEHYSGMLQQMRNYIATGTGDTYKLGEIKPLISHLKNDNVKNDSWLDLFFTKNINIIGLSLSFAETDIWWLLTYRARQKFKHKPPITNKITYYFPEEFRNNSVIGLLEATGVRTIGIKLTHSIKYYETVIDAILS